MWHAIVPVKTWDAAKSRLDVPDEARVALSRAMARDTLTALAQCPAVARISVLTGSPDQQTAPEFLAADHVAVQPARQLDLNAAIRAVAMDSHDDREPTLVVVADLPAATSGAFERALGEAANLESALIVDRDGRGTTVLTAQSPSALRPRFGARSAQRHQEGGATALRLDDWGEGLRCDVDTVADLRAAGRLGVGQHTADAVRATGMTGMTR